MAARRVVWWADEKDGWLVVETAGVRVAKKVVRRECSLVG
jgi:hypothetical protein